MKKIFVTGATGLLGANVVIKLLKDGYFVIALLRKESSYLGQKDENLKLITGDLFTDISELLTDVDCFIHIAAETRQDFFDYEEYKTVNYDAVIKLFTQAEASGVRRFILISSANTLGYGTREKPGEEQNPPRYPFTKSLYAQSKLEAENYVLQKKGNTEVIILCPTFMIGAYDHKPSSGKIIFWAWKKKIIFYPKGGKNFVHAEDVADGILKAIDGGKNGEKYLLANENLTYKDFFRKINNISGQRPVMIPIPDSVLDLLGWMGDRLRKANIKTNLSAHNMKALQIHNYYSGQKSVKELGVRYQPVDKAIHDAIDYFTLKEIY
ncbi:dihydroflavonol 4-reductase [Chryseobacterium indologenes]|uniref:NAD-dependent epimerase/dehydratase family protein n=2 Tax=Chryseobacterium indologenes TaxID=253 RepID=UPI000BFC8F06|nr:NAD-dependent epimerase/dehydratase family protein [Chryseobacterium indologenes]ATN05569.1 dihydroflavonol 4-reductase [Chryseobacterium indologenes]AYY85671.1 NAD-dependent epimerase/dehydratase family protein [Chryseobacterium indologenes]QIX82574.1 NAD-dependent epimerase/dehydratase family protein [Chryseobacterium indologenes]UDQ52224.1 NAD-dependent epimerase/dehydratase family protein [Chryseobacterium indologenes]